MQITKHIENVMERDPQIIFVAIFSCLSCFIVINIYLHLVASSLLVTFILGIIENALMLIFAYHTTNAIKRIRYSYINILISGLIFMLGSYTQQNILLANLILAGLLFLSIFSERHHNLFNTMIFFAIVSFLIGSGTLISNTNQIVYQGIAYAMGGWILIFIGIIRIQIRIHYFKINEQFINNQNLPSKFLNFNYERIITFIYALFAVLLSNTFFLYFKIDHGYWLPLTAFLITRSQHHITKIRAKQRIIGTLFGCGFIYACKEITDYLPFYMTLFILDIFFSIVGITKNYRFFSFFITVTILTLLFITNKNFDVVANRLKYTIIAVVFTMSIAYIAKPFYNIFNSKQKKSLNN